MLFTGPDGGLADEEGHGLNGTALAISSTYLKIKNA
jgi:hypothetical protein